MTQVRTSRVRRTWLDKLLLWQRAYETRIFDEHREVSGRGPTPEASQDAAERRWVAELPSEQIESAGVGECGDYQVADLHVLQARVNDLELGRPLPGDEPNSGSNPGSRSGIPC
jgi:hypothetical protein